MVWIVHIWVRASDAACGQWAQFWAFREMTEGKQHIARGPAGGRSLGLLHLDGQPHLCNQNSILLTVWVSIPSTACRKHKTTWLIGRKCKCSDVFSLSILIGRGLDQDKWLNSKWYAVFRVLTLKKLYKKVLTLLIENVNIILVLKRRAKI